MTAKPTYDRIAMLLDACLPALEDAAKREAKEKPIAGILRPVTWQTRLVTVREVVAAAMDSTEDFHPHPTTDGLDPAFYALADNEISVARMHEIVSLWLSGQPYDLPDDAGETR